MRTFTVDLDDPNEPDDAEINCAEVAFNVESEWKEITIGSKILFQQGSYRTNRRQKVPYDLWHKGMTFSTWLD